MEYAEFILNKSQQNTGCGFEPVFMPDFLFDFQKHLVDLSVRMGRFANFSDCGLGKSPMELVWAQNVVMRTNKNVLMCTPLAVSLQMIHEAEKFGIEVIRSTDGVAARGITVTNYEQLHKFNHNDFVGFVGDESSIIKNFKGTTKGTVTNFVRHLPYRLLASATAAPNDYIELGTTSEALGYLGHMDMLNRFFKNDLNNSATGRIGGDAIKWRFKGHAEQAFWRWVCSWARAVRKPSDLGYDDRNMVLPSLAEQEHLVEAKSIPSGMLFALPAVGLKEQREEKRRSIEERCIKMAELVNQTGQPFTAWCHLNDEGDMLEKMMPDAIQVSGRDSDEAKEEKLMAFSQNKVRGMIIKPKIGAFGLNWQHCNHVLTFPSHSYEQYYQLVRRCWRFGQTRPVHVDVITTEGENGVLKNLQRKTVQAEKMFDNLVEEMGQSLHIDRSVNFTKKLEVASWM